MDGMDILRQPYVRKAYKLKFYLISCSHQEFRSIPKSSTKSLRRYKVSFVYPFHDCDYHGFRPFSLDVGRYQFL